MADATPAFRISTGGLGAFPRPARARVLWYGIGDEDERLASLAGAVGDAVGVHEARPFHAHLTLARAREETGVALEQWLRSHDAPGGEIAVQELVLFRSHLGRGPAQYEAIVRFPLVELASAGRAAERGAQHG